MSIIQDHRVRDSIVTGSGWILTVEASVVTEFALNLTAFGLIEADPESFAALTAAFAVVLFCSTLDDPAPAEDELAWRLLRQISPELAKMGLVVAVVDTGRYPALAHANGTTHLPALVIFRQGTPTVTLLANELIQLIKHGPSGLCPSTGTTEED